MAGLRLSQGIVSFNIGLGLVDERQGLLVEAKTRFAVIFSERFSN